MTSVALSGGKLPGVIGAFFLAKTTERARRFYKDKKHYG